MKRAAKFMPDFKRLLLAVFDAVLCAFAGGVAVGAFGSAGDTSVYEFILLSAAAGAIGSIGLVSAGLYRIVTSELVGRDLLRFLTASVIAGLLGGIALSAVNGVADAAGAAAGFAAIMFVIVATVHFAGAWARRVLAWRGGTRERVIVYGAGQAGMQLTTALDRTSSHHPVAFVDDNPDLIGRVSRGLVIYSPDRLPELTVSLGVSKILFAVPSATPSRRRAILSRLEALPVKVASVPGMADLAAGRAQLSDLRHIEIEELLERDPVSPLPDLLRCCIAGKSVMVTGAGGSIGSEMCRQILRQEPKRLVLYELSEAALFPIVQELKQKYAGSGIEIVPVIGNTLDYARLERAGRKCAVQTIYHAAAYKHVLLVEQNVNEGAHNNIISTLNVCKLAVACGVESMTLISTDKAVRPTSVMGATKRFAEMIVQAYALEATGRGDPRFSVVRFGNVLGSSGSVVPIFRAQIAAGGPVTVSHPEVTRYFMTIPEASQLVIQASAMARSGDLFVLDMGKPVRIYDLARRMIRLSGYTERDAESPDGDIEIVISGLKPGEKLYEELLVAANAEATVHPGIWRAREPSMPPDAVRQALGRLNTVIAGGSASETVALLKDVVGGFTPAKEMIDVLASADANGGTAVPRPVGD